MRLSYAKNSGTNQIEILDRNDYYAFGMNMYEQNSVYDAMGTPLNYKYNGKELQETGMYDYGWRQYMPDLGRWFGMDQLSEKYHMTSPYAYAVNNPVMFYDIDGRDMPGWLQNLWDATKENKVTTFGGFDSSGNPSSVSFGGSFSTEQFTSFVNFLQGGGTGNYTFWTGSGMTGGNSGGELFVYMQASVGYNINITDSKAGAWRGEQARSRLHEAIEKEWGKYAFGISAGGSLGNATGSLTLAFNFGTGQANLFGTTGLKLGPPSFEAGFQLNQMNAFGTRPDGQPFTDVFGGAKGESTAVSGSYFIGTEYSESTRNGHPLDYGTATRSVNLGVGYDVGVSSTNTFSISDWIRTYFK